MVNAQKLLPHEHENSEYGHVPSTRFPATEELAFAPRFRIMVYRTSGDFSTKQPPTKKQEHIFGALVIGQCSKNISLFFFALFFFWSCKLWGCGGDAHVISDLAQHRLLCRKLRVLADKMACFQIIFPLAGPSWGPAAGYSLASLARVPYCSVVVIVGVIGVLGCCCEWRWW